MSIRLSLLYNIHHRLHLPIASVAAFPTNRRLSRSHNSIFGLQLVRGFRAMATLKKAFPGNWQKITISNPIGEKLVGILDDTGSEDMIVLCHGFRSSKESATLINIASTLLETGLSTFRFDFSGNGESDGEFQYGNYWKEVEDLRSVVTFWRGQGRRVRALIGHSKGGNAALLYASRYKDVGTIVNISGRFNLARGVKERLGEKGLQMIEKQGYMEVKDKYGNVEYRVTKKSLNERLSTDMKAAVSSIPEHCGVLTLHGSEDEIVNVEEAKEFDSLIASHTLLILDGANHSYSQHQRVLASIIVDLIKDGRSNNCADDGKEAKFTSPDESASRL